MYALGASLYHLLTLVEPPSALDRLRAKVDPLINITSLNPDIPAKAAKCIMMSLDLDPGERPSAYWFREDAVSGRPDIPFLKEYEAKMRIEAASNRGPLAKVDADLAIQDIELLKEGQILTSAEECLRRRISAYRIRESLFSMHAPKELLAARRFSEMVLASIKAGSTSIGHIDYERELNAQIHDIEMQKARLSIFTPPQIIVQRTCS